MDAIDRKGTHDHHRNGSGATTDTILTTSQQLWFRRVPPQIEQINAQLDLVTVTAGGNDLGYLGSILKAAFADRFSRRPLTRALGRRMRGEPVQITMDHVDHDSQAELVRVSALSETHAVDATEPWVHGLRPGFTPVNISSSFHPNAAGMQAVATAIVDHLHRG